MSLKFFSLHNHTSYSVYDGYGDVGDYAEWMLENAGEDSGGFAITDHGHCNAYGSIAANQKKYGAKKAPVKIIYGMEAYVLPSLAQWDRLKIEREKLKEIQLKEKKEKKKTKSKSKSPEELVVAEEPIVDFVEMQDDSDEEGLVIENEKESKGKHFDPFFRRNHLVLLAQNSVGLKNLYRLTSRSFREGFYRKPRIDFRMLEQFNEGLIASSACLASMFNYHTMQSATMQEAHARYDKEILPLMEVFGKDRFFLELQFNNIPEQQIVNQHLVGYAKKTGYKLIVTADAHYQRPEDWKAREIYKLLGYQTKKQEIDKKILDMQESELECALYLKNGDQIFQAYKDSAFYKLCPDEQLIKEAIERSYVIAHEACENVKPDSTPKLPISRYVDKEKGSFKSLQDLVITALKELGLDKNKVYVDRAIRELQVIKKLNHADYFLTEKEILDVARKEMFVGPGRGSAGGSLVAFLLKITDIDPIVEGTIFERFLSLDRKDLPDIDSDVGDRDRALELFRNHFGSDNVLAITNYNKLQLKSLIKDLSKLHDVPFAEANKVTAVIEKEAKKKILAEINNDQKLYDLNYDNALKHSPTFQEYVKKYPAVTEHIKALYKEVKSLGRHAGGCLIIPDAESHVPIIKSKKIDQSPIAEGITAQHAGFFGLVKFDVLGLATLKIMYRCVEYILQTMGNKNPSTADCWEFYDAFLSPRVISKHDEKIYENVYWNKNFPSIFQFEESAVQEFVAKAKPKTIHEIAVITSIFRPGPLSAKADQAYLEADVEKIEKEHPVIKRILKVSKGVLCFQEQFMQLSNELGGFTLEEADQLRKLLVKPAQDLGPELIEKRKQARLKFINGCIASGVEEKRAYKLWDEEIAGFISYGFNSAHAIAYAYISFQCAWLFTRYPIQWLKACLEKDPNLHDILNTVRGIGYNINKVDPLLSEVGEWQHVNDFFVPPLNSLKGVGDAGAKELVVHRKMDVLSDFHNLFFTKTESFRWSKLNKNCIKSLVKAGAFSGSSSLKFVGNDCLFKHDRAFFEFIEECWEDFKKGKDMSQHIGACNELPDWTDMEKIKIEKEILGFYDKSNILKTIKPIIQEFEIESVDNFTEDGPRQKVWGVVEEVVEKTSPKGKKYYTITVSGEHNRDVTFKCFIFGSKQIQEWTPGSVFVFGLNYDEWGYSLSKDSKTIKIM